MATTTNFGWDTPDDTDLVKDGALAIRTLGSSIDTSFVDLKGGTTGQVLSKASNTDLDYTWVTTDDANAIQNAIVDAKGDLIAASAADTPARLAVGNNGDTLVADSAASTGLRYTAGVGLTQPVINGGFDVWQRGTSFAGQNTNTYTADRWVGYRIGSTFSRQTTSDTTNLPFIQYCIRAQRDSGGTGTSGIIVAQAFETVNSIPYAGKTVTLSFYARKGADYSAASDALAIVLQSGTGTDQQPTNNFTGYINAISQNVTLTSTWQRFTITTASALSSTLTQLRIAFTSTPVGTASTNDYFEVTGVQLDVGQTALPFRRSGGTIQGELAACQRYFYQINGNDGGGTQVALITGTYTGTTAIKGFFPFPVKMRTAPSVTSSNSASYFAIGGGGGGNADTVGSIQYVGTTGCSMNFTASASSTIGYSCIVLTNNASAYVALSAEL